MQDGLNSDMQVLQISCSWDERLGGPPEVARQVSSKIHDNFKNCETIVVGIVDQRIFRELDPAPKIFNSIFDNRYGLSFKVLHLKFLKKLRQADLVICHAHYSFPTFIALLVSKGRILIMPHGNLEPIKFKKSRIKKFLYDRLFFSVVPSHKLEFIVASESEITSVLRRFPKVKCRKVGLGVERPSDEFIKLREVGNPINLITLSRLDPIKRIDIAIKGLARAKQSIDFSLCLKVTGQGDSSQLKQIVDSLDLNREVEFMGWLSKSNREEFLLNAHVLVQPSDNDNFAISVAESIIRGIPVIVSDQVGMSEFVSQYSVGIVIPSNDEVALANAIKVMVKELDAYSANCLVYGHLLAWNEVFLNNWKPLLEESR